jgi:hypothetical protein
MATFTITTNTNWDTQTGKTGGDIININGGNLTIDGHSRFDLNGANTSATAATTLGSISRYLQRWVERVLLMVER